MANPLNAEFATLSDLLKSAVRDIVGTARGTEGHHAISLYTGDEAYAYQGADGKVHWGVNTGATGHCVARGVFLDGEALHG